MIGRNDETTMASCEFKTKFKFHEYGESLSSNGVGVRCGNCDRQARTEEIMYLCF